MIKKKRRKISFLSWIKKEKVKIYKKTGEDFTFPKSIRLHSYVLLGKLEYYAKTSNTIVPLDKSGNEIFTWEALSQYNVRFSQIKEEIIVYEQNARDIFCDADWNDAAKKFIEALVTYREEALAIKEQEKELEVA